MLKIFTNNWFAKIVCLVFALGLWAYVAASSNVLATLPNKIPVEIKNISNTLSAVTNIETVELKVSADRSVLSSLNTNSFTAFIDTKGLKEGTYELDIQVISNVSGAVVTNIEPKKALVYIEPVSKKKVPVKVQTEGQAAEGLIPGDAVITPSEVEISGATSVVGKIMESTARIIINGESDNIEKTVEVVCLDAQGNIIKGITFEPKEVKVTLPIVKAGSTKSVGIKTKLTGNVKTGYWVSQIITTPSDVAIRATSGILQSVNYIETKSIDITNLSQNTVKYVDLDLPSGVTLADNISQIKVEIKISQTSADKEVNAGFIYDNLSSNLKVDSVDPSIIKCIISGNTEVLNSLNSGNVQLVLNLSTYKSAGSYTVDISKDMFTVPDGASVTSYVPSSIKINLSNK